MPTPTKHLPSAALACILTLVACAPTQRPEPQDPPAPATLPKVLANSSWRLREFQSMDDAIGVQRPEDKALYTMRLNADGTVQMRLHCNRAQGTWSAEPSKDGDSGGFRFGPLAVTRAMCPPSSMDQSIAAQAPYIRSYLLRDGNLYLSLMADGGIYAWEPDDQDTPGGALLAPAP